MCPCAAEKSRWRGGAEGLDSAGVAYSTQHLGKPIVGRERDSPDLAGEAMALAKRPGSLQERAFAPRVGGQRDQRQTPEPGCEAIGWLVRPHQDSEAAAPMEEMLGLRLEPAEIHDHGLAGRDASPSPMRRQGSGTTAPSLSSDISGLLETHEPCPGQIGARA
jgi:hypothetical protein